MIASDAPPTWAGFKTIQIFSATGGQPKNLVPSFDAQPAIAGWSADGKRIYFSEAKGTGTQIYALDLAANRIAEVKTTSALISSIDLNRSATTFGFVGQTSDTPAEVFVASVSDLTPVQITKANADLKVPPVGRTEVITWKSKDGKQIEGLLTYPVGYQTVPISQGYEFYNALKVKGVPTRMLVLPRQPHGPTEPKMQLAVMKANLEWFEKYIGSKRETSRN